MSAKTREKKEIKKEIAAGELALAKLSNVRQHHADRIKKLDTKIAAREYEIADLKEEL